MATVAEILYNLRETKQLEKKDMAEKLSISTQLYGQYEGAGKGKPKIPGLLFAVKYKEVFGDNLIDLLCETNVSRETNSDAPDPSHEQVPVLLYGEMRELVKAVQQIAENTRKEPPEVLGTVQDEIDKGKPPGKGKSSKH